MLQFINKNRITAFVLFFALAASAEEPKKFPNADTKRFQELESINSMIVKTSVDPEHQPGVGKIFTLPYVEVPKDEIVLVDSGLLPAALRKHVEVIRDGKTFVRYFFHPESTKLYQPLMDKFSKGKPSGFYFASPTASTRSLIAWDPTHSDLAPVILKTSLAREQDALGRVIPDWEVRRSVLISKMVGSTPAAEWIKAGTSIIPESFGAYVPESMNLGFFVDKKQGMVKKHGYILRELSFLTDFASEGEVYPMFALFTERPDGPPLIVRWWKQSGVADFHDFLSDTIVRPFMERTGWLFFEQGIVPQLHSQNVLVVIDPKTHALKRVLHRDIGSMKIDLRLRLAKGLSVEALKTKNSAYDFKFQEADALYEDYILGYFFDMTFSMDPTLGYGKAIKPHVPDYKSVKIRSIVKAEFQKQLNQHLPLKSTKAIKDAKAHVRQWLVENPPKTMPVVALKKTKVEGLAEWVAERKAGKQYLDLPASWENLFKDAGGSAFITDFGLVVKEGKDYKLYTWDKEETYTKFLGEADKLGGDVCPLYLRKK